MCTSMHYRHHTALDLHATPYAWTCLYVEVALPVCVLPMLPEPYLFRQKANGSVAVVAVYQQLQFKFA